jgi:hypothetical protein
MTPRQKRRFPPSLNAFQPTINRQPGAGTKAQLRTNFFNGPHRRCPVTACGSTIVMRSFVRSFLTWYSTHHAIALASISDSTFSGGRNTGKHWAIASGRIDTVEAVTAFHRRHSTRHLQFRFIYSFTIPNSVFALSSSCDNNQHFSVQLGLQFQGYFQ